MAHLIKVYTVLDLSLFSDKSTACKIDCHKKSLSETGTLIFILFCRALAKRE